MPKAIQPSSARFFDSFTFLRLLQFSNALFPIFVTVSGISMLSSLPQSLNAEPPISVTVSGILIALKLLQFLSILSGIAVIPSSKTTFCKLSLSESGPFPQLLALAVFMLFGISIYVRESQLPKAIQPSSTRFFDSFTLDRLLQFSNALFSIFVTVSGISMLSSTGQLANALAAITVTLYPSIVSGTCTCVSLPLYFLIVAFPSLYKTYSNESLKASVAMLSEATETSL